MLPFPDPPLTIGTTTLRPWADAELPTLVAAGRDPQVHRFRHSLPDTEPQAHEWLRRAEDARCQRDRIEFAIADAQDAVGGVSLWNFHPHNRTAYVSYWLLAQGRGHGHATAAVTLAARYAFTTLELGRLTARIESANGASQRVITRAGFTHEGTLRDDAIDRGGRRVDVHLYGLVRSDRKR